MLASVIHIDHLTIKMKHCRCFINNAIFSQNEIRTGEVTIGECNIDELTEDIETNDGYYYPKRIWEYMLPFLVRIIEETILMKCIYSFGLNQNDPDQNPYDRQSINKDIEVVLDFESPEGTACKIIKRVYR